MTRFGTVWPVAKLTFDVFGFSPPSAKAVTWPPLVVLVAVTLRTTAVTPAGMPPFPPIFRCAEEYAATLPAGAPVPLRVSSRRVGPYGV